MNFLVHLDLRDLPNLNYLAVTSINFITLTLLLMVFNHNRFKDGKSRLFGLMAVFILLWVDFAFAARLFGKYLFLSEIFLRIAWIATPFLFYATYLVSVSLVNKKNKYYKYVNFFILGSSIILGILIGFTNCIIEGITFTNSTLDIAYGIFFYPFLLIIFIYMLATICVIFKGRMNAGIKIFLFGIIIFYLANAIFNIILPVFLGVTYLYYIGDYSTIVLLSLTVYSILRHELFDIRVVSAEMLVIFIWFVVILKIIITPNSNFLYIDLVELIILLILGVFLIRSVISEVAQKRKLEELTRKLKELDERKDEFLSIVAHELRAPLTAVKGYVSMILDGDTGGVSDETRDFLFDVTNSNDRMIRLVGNMLDMSRIEENRIVYQISNTHLREILEDVQKEFSFEAKRSELELKLEIPDGLHDFVRVDKDRLHEVISNLISNALKYTEEGSVTIRALNPQNSQTIRVEVTDTGRGIPKDEQKNLFQKFYRGESEKEKSTGTGLGLYVSKLLIESFKGEIGVVSSEGQGSTFWFELPLLPSK